MANKEIVDIPALLSDKSIAKIDFQQIDAAVDYTIDHLADGTPTEKLAKCKGILRGTMNVDGLQERISAIAGAVIAQIRDEQLWRYEMKPDKNGKVKTIDPGTAPKWDGARTDYRDADEFLATNFPFSPARLNQLHDAHEYRRVFVPELKEIGVETKALPLGELDVRECLAAQKAIQKWAKDKEHTGKVIVYADPETEDEVSVTLKGATPEGALIAQQLARNGALLVYTMAVEKNAAKDKPKDKPSYSDFREAKRELLETWGVIKRKEMKGGAKGATVTTTSTPVPDIVKPPMFSVALTTVVKRLKAWQSQMDTLTAEREKYPDGAEREEFFDMLLEDQGQRLCVLADTLSNEFRVVANAWDFHHGAILVDGKKVPANKAQRLPADPKIKEAADKTVTAQPKARKRGQGATATA